MYPIQRSGKATRYDVVIIYIYIERYRYISTVIKLCCTGRRDGGVCLPTRGGGTLLCACGGEYSCVLNICSQLPQLLAKMWGV